MNFFKFRICLIEVPPEVPRGYADMGPVEGGFGGRACAIGGVKRPRRSPSATARVRERGRRGALGRLPSPSSYGPPWLGATARRTGDAGRVV